MNGKQGFTLMELIVVVAIIAITTAAGTPAYLQYRQKAELRDVVNRLRTDFQMARLQAIREDALVPVVFSADGYLAFVDDGRGGGTAGNWIADGDERLLMERKMAGRVRIDLSETTFYKDRTRFDGRGFPRNIGTVVIDDGRGGGRKLAVSMLGRIRVSEY